MSSQSDDPFTVAERFFAAIENGDIATVEALYAEDVVVWHNTDRKEKTKAESLSNIRWGLAALRDLRYLQVRRTHTEHGFVQQHLFEAIQADGSKVQQEMVTICTVRDGRITRLDEYCDSAQSPKGVPVVHAASDA
jgi:ketosteroid isomerase-like protein